MCVKRVAGNEVSSADGLLFVPGVVELDNAGNVVTAYTLKGEMAHTLWIGGRIEIRKVDDGKLKAYKNEREITI